MHLESFSEINARRDAKLTIDTYKSIVCVLSFIDLFAGTRPATCLQPLHSGGREREGLGYLG